MKNPAEAKAESHQQPSSVSLSGPIADSGTIWASDPGGFPSCAIRLTGCTTEVEASNIASGNKNPAERGQCHGLMGQPAAEALGCGMRLPW